MNLESHDSSESPKDISLHPGRARLIAIVCAVMILAAAGIVWILESRGLAGKDLTERDFSGARLHGQDLAKSNLTAARLTDADLSGADLSGADLRRATLDGADLSGAVLRGANLSGARLVRASLVRADLTGAILEDTNMFLANLQSAKLVDVELDGAYFEKSDFTAAHLENARLSNRSVLRASVGLTDQQLAKALLISDSALPRILIERDLRIDYTERVRDGLSAACVGGRIEGVDPYPGNTDYHPVVTFSLGAGSNTYELDQSTVGLGWEPMLRRHTQLVACIDRGWNMVQRCPGEWYRESDKHRVDLRRVREWVHLRIVAASTAEVVFDSRLDGPAPPGCPYSHTEIADQTGAMHGELVPSAEIKGQIAALVAPR